MVYLDDQFNETAQKVVVTKNEYGDTIYGLATATSCKYRNVSRLQQSQNRLDVNIDGMMWFAPTEDVELGDIYYHVAEGYLKIEGITKAKDLLRDNIIRFIKCDVSKQRQLS